MRKKFSLPTTADCCVAQFQTIVACCWRHTTTIALRYDRISNDLWVVWHACCNEKPPRFLESKPNKFFFRKKNTIHSQQKINQRRKISKMEIENIRKWTNKRIENCEKTMNRSCNTFFHVFEEKSCKNLFRRKKFTKTRKTNNILINKSIILKITNKTYLNEKEYF